MSEHKEAFHAFKEALVTVPVLGNLDFSKEFVLETNASLKGLGAMLSQQGSYGKLCVIVHASLSLHPSATSMCKYSLAKLNQ